MKPACDPVTAGQGIINLKEDIPMGDEKRVKDIMTHIDEYERLDQDARLCDALAILRKKFEERGTQATGIFHKTLLVTNDSKEIIGKLSIYDFIRGLVPEQAKRPSYSRSFYNMLASRAQSVADEVSAMQESFRWLHATFFDLVKQETQKRVRDVMSPAHPLLQEEDTLNKAIYVMFKEDIRQPMVVKGGEIVGMVSFMDLFPELLEIAGDQCFFE
jgi:CBS domain containing-hemolysin-like protein